MAMVTNNHLQHEVAFVPMNLSESIHHVILVLIESGITIGSSNEIMQIDKRQYPKLVSHLGVEVTGSTKQKFIARE